MGYFRKAISKNPALSMSKSFAAKFTTHPDTDIQGIENPQKKSRASRQRCLGLFSVGRHEAAVHD